MSQFSLFRHFVVRVRIHFSSHLSVEQDAKSKVFVGKFVIQSGFPFRIGCGYVFNLSRTFGQSVIIDDNVSFRVAHQFVAPEVACRTSHASDDGDVADTAD